MVYRMRYYYGTGDRITKNDSSLTPDPNFDGDKMLVYPEREKPIAHSSTSTDDRSNANVQRPMVWIVWELDY